MNGKKKKAGLFLFLTLGPAYLLIMFIAVHTLHVLMEKPWLGLVEAVETGIMDMLRHPFRILPLAPGTGKALLWLTVLIGSVTALILLDTRLRRHDNPDTVQGDARWMTALDRYNREYTEPFGEAGHEGVGNMILSRDIFMSMNSRKIRRNLNVFVIGGSGAGKSYNFVGPNLMQANCSYIITDPSGGLYREYGKFLEYKGYRIKCFNLTHMEKGNRYNPFRYIHSDKDIEVLVTTLISNTTPPDRQGGDPFWEKSETALLVALIAFLYHYTKPECQNFSNVMTLMRAADINEYDSNDKSALDYIFEEVAAAEPDSFAVKQYRTFKMGAGKTLKGILISCAVRLQAFDLEDVARLTDTDDIDLDSVGDEKTALFIIVPTGEKTFNFLAAMMYSQLFQRAYDYCENTSEFSQLVMDRDGQLVKCFRARTPEEALEKRKEAEAFLDRARRGSLVYDRTLGLYEVVTERDEIVCFRGSEEEAGFALDAIIEGGHVISNREQSNHGQRLPVHTRMILDEFANIGKIPEFDQKVATIRKYEISVSIILQSLAQMQKLYKDDWSDIAGNCDTTLYLGGGADTVTAKWISELLGKQTRIVMNVSYSKSGGSTSLNRQGVELYAPSQLRTMPEDECIVIPKSMYAYKGKKYRPKDHPCRELVGRLGPYYFSEGRKNLFRSLLDEEKEEEDPYSAHGGEPAERTEEEILAMEGENRARKQRADEIRENKDAEGQPVIGDPVPLREDRTDRGTVTREEDGKSKKEAFPARGKEDDAWEELDLTFFSAPAEDFQRADRVSKPTGRFPAHDRKE